METGPIYEGKKLSFDEYLKEMGIMDKYISAKIDMHRDTFIKKRKDPTSFTWGQIKKVAAHLNLTTQEFIEKFLD